MPAPAAAKQVPVSRPLLALQMAAFATAAWLLLSLLDPGEHARLLRPVALAILGLIAAWAGAFAAILWIYVAVSLDRFSDLRREARRASVHALWFQEVFFCCLRLHRPRRSSASR